MKGLDSRQVARRRAKDLAASAEARRVIPFDRATCGRAERCLSPQPAQGAGVAGSGAWGREQHCCDQHPPLPLSHTLVQAVEEVTVAIHQTLEAMLKEMSELDLRNGRIYPQ